MTDQRGMREIGQAIAGLADDPYPSGAFHRGEYHRMRVGLYRVVYVIDDDVVTIERVDRPDA
jgi:mRNA-degrading endonuclease RelE of RelBE toxin-antitoxin system